MAVKMFKMEDAECFGEELEEDDSVIVGKITIEPREQKFNRDFPLRDPPRFEQVAVRQTFS